MIWDYSYFSTQAYVIKIYHLFWNHAHVGKASFLYTPDDDSAQHSRLCGMATCLHFNAGGLCTYSADDYLKASFEQQGRLRSDLFYCLIFLNLKKPHRCTRNDNRRLLMSQFQQKNFIQTTQVQPTVVPANPRLATVGQFDADHDPYPCIGHLLGCIV